MATLCRSVLTAFHTTAPTHTLAVILKSIHKGKSKLTVPALLSHFCLSLHIFISQSCLRSHLPWPLVLCLDALALSQPARFAFKHPFASSLTISLHLLRLGLESRTPVLCLCLTLVPNHGCWQNRFPIWRTKTDTGTPLSARRNCLIHWAAQSQTRGTTLKKSFVHYLALRISVRITFHLWLF